MAEVHSDSSGSTAAMVAIVAIVLLVMIGFFFVRGWGRHGGTGGGAGVRGNVEVTVPRSPTPGR